MAKASGRLNNIFRRPEAFAKRPFRRACAGIAYLQKTCPKNMLCSSHAARPRFQTALSYTNSKKVS
jgi:hypothetical protein